MDKLKSLFYEFKSMELKHEELKKLQGGGSNLAVSQSATIGKEKNTCGENPCCTETAQVDCCTYEDTGTLPLSDCDPDGEIADFCV